jgi:hypothetical protein
LAPPEVGMNAPSVTYRLSNSQALQLGSSTESFGSVPKRAPPRMWLAIRASAFSAW